MATKIQLRRDTSSNWAILNVTLSSGEIGFEIDTNKFKIGNGSSAWSALPYFSEEQDLSSYATTSSLNSGIVSASAAAVSYLVDSAPAALNTLNELAAAIADDANYASTITTALGNKLNISTASSTYLTQSSASTTYAPIVPTTQTGFRNAIINGSFRIDQRNAGALKNNNSVNTNQSTTFGADRWLVHEANTSTVFSQSKSDGTGSDKYYLYAGRPSSLNSITIAQKIESINSYHLAGKTVTLSFRASLSTGTSLTWKASYANTTDSFGTFASPTTTQIATGTVTVGSTFTYNSVTFTVPSEATTGIEISFTSPTEFGVSLNLSQVQLELGSIATPFEQRPIGTELNLCQRYFYGPLGTANNQPLGTGVATTTSTGRVAITYPVTLRTTPTLAFVGTTRIGYTSLGDVQYVTATFVSSILGPFGSSISFEVPGTPLTVGQAIFYVNTTSAATQFSAEL